jgi:hypothetical protein
MNFEDDEDHLVPAPLTEAVKVYWSKPRCWHGDKVYIRVRTRHVKDGSHIKLEVFPQGVVVVLETIPNQAITGDKLDYEYTLSWKTKVSPPPYPSQVEVRATVVELNLVSALSPVMNVDLIPPLFSA